MKNSSLFLSILLKFLGRFLIYECNRLQRNKFTNLKTHKIMRQPIIDWKFENGKIIVTMNDPNLNK